jgi:hypothetical protein
MRNRSLQSRDGHREAEEYAGEGNDDGFLLRSQNGSPRSLWRPGVELAPIVLSSLWIKNSPSMPGLNT